MTDGAAEIYEAETTSLSVIRQNIDRQHEELAEKRKAGPRQLRGLNQSRKTRPLYQNASYYEIRDAHKHLIDMSLHDDMFRLPTIGRTTSIQKFPQSVIGSGVYHRFVDNISYSKPFENALLSHFGAFAAGMPYQLHWNDQSFEQRQRFFQATDKAFWDGLDPEGEYCRALDPDFRKNRKKLYPTIDISGDPVGPGLLQEIVLNNVRHFKPSTAGKAAGLLLDGFMKEAKNEGMASYSGVDDDTIQVKLYDTMTYHSSVTATMSAKRSIVTAENHDRTRKLLQRTFNLDNASSHLWIGDHFSLVRDNDMYELVHYPCESFDTVMNHFTHEEAHRVIDVAALYYERTGKSLLEFQQTDYEMTKISWANYVDAKERYSLYYPNLLEKMARKVGNKVQKIITLGE